MLEAYCAEVVASLRQLTEATGGGPVDLFLPWIHCFLVRELGPSLSLRLWDTYLSIGEGFAQFHACVCAAIIVSIRSAIVDQPLDVVLAAVKAPLAHALRIAASRGAAVALPANFSPLTIGTDAAEAAAAEVATDLPSTNANAVSVAAFDWLEGVIALAYMIHARHAPMRVVV